MSNPNTALTARIEGRIDREAAGAVTIAGRGATSPVFQTMGQILEFAKIMAVSDIGIRKHLRNNPGACAAVCLQAGRWAMDPFMVANKSYLVNDQIAYESQLIAAVVNTRAPIRGRLKTRFIGEGDGRQCIAWATFEGEDEPTEVQSPPFGKITPKNSPLWKSDPDQQLAYYTQRLWARRQVPELLLGVYDIDEVSTASQGDMRDVTPPPRPTRAAIAANPEPEPEPVETFTFIKGDGEAIDVAGPAEFGRLFADALDEAETQSALDGIWETNSPTLGLLRDAGKTLLADTLHSLYDERLRATRNPKTSESASPPTTQTASAGGDVAPHAAETPAEAPSLTPHPLALPVATHEQQLVFLAAFEAQAGTSATGDEMREWERLNEKKLTACAAAKSHYRDMRVRLDAARARLDGEA